MLESSKIGIVTKKDLEKQLLHCERYLYYNIDFPIEGYNYELKKTDM